MVAWFEQFGTTKAITADGLKVHAFLQQVYGKHPVVVIYDCIPQLQILLLQPPGVLCYFLLQDSISSFKDRYTELTS